VVEIRSVSKRFPGVQALEDVSLDIRPGEVHAVAGENGAGKSTLMKLLSQLERPSDGTIEIDGEPVRFRNPRYAQRLGIAMVHQEFALAPHLSVADNLALGREQTRAGLIVRSSEKQRARELLERVQLDIDPGRRVSTLSVADQQRVEIAKALAVDAKVVIMDEPTATLTEAEIDDLFRLIEDLKDDGIAIFYISHRLEEVVRIADRVTVMPRRPRAASAPGWDRSHDHGPVRELVRGHGRDARPRGPASVDRRGHGVGPAARAGRGRAGARSLLPPSRVPRCPTSRPRRTRSGLADAPARPREPDAAG
jgi:ABC-type sugar transport system ATPase subunit